jgi:hypothetical protein
MEGASVLESVKNDPSRSRNWRVHTRNAILSMAEKIQMSCDDCEIIQDEWTKWTNDSFLQVYIRVGNANIQVIGCDKHLKDLSDLLRKAKK